jgi:NADH dehydrogenase
VVGDLAVSKGADGHALPGVAQVAIQGGQHAARNILCTVNGTPRTPFVYRNLGNMATIGRNSAVNDYGWLTLKGRLAWLMWLFVHIFNLIGFRNRLSVMTQWAFAYLTYQRSVRLITGDDSWHEAK